MHVVSRDIGMLRMLHLVFVFVIQNLGGSIYIGINREFCRLTYCTKILVKCNTEKVLLVLSIIDWD